MRKARNKGADKKAVGRGGQRDHEILRFHALGLRVLKKVAEDNVDEARAARFVGELEGVSIDRAMKAAMFARRLQNRSLNKLCDIRFRDGTPLSVNHLRRVLKVKDPGDWRAWLERAASAGWSANRRYREIKQTIKTSPTKDGPQATKAAGPRPRLGGPRVKGPVDLIDTLDQVSERSEAWLKRYDAVWSRETAWPDKIGLGDADPAAIKTRLCEIREDLVRLQGGVKAMVGRIKAIEEDLDQKEKQKVEKVVNGKRVGKARR